jgi:hypothetical protein
LAAALVEVRTLRYKKYDSELAAQKQIRRTHKTNEQIIQSAIFFKFAITYFSRLS